MLSTVEIEGHAAYEGPTWLDQAIIGKWQVDQGMPGFAAELRETLAARGRWLTGRGLADHAVADEVTPKPEMMSSLRRQETGRIAENLSRQLNAVYLPHEPGSRISGVYERAVTTPIGKLAVIRREDTFTLAPWKPALEQMRGRSVIGFVGQSRLTWTLDRGRGLPEHS